MTRGRWRIVVGNVIADIGIHLKVVAERLEDAGDALLDWANAVDPEAGSLSRLQAEAAKARSRA